MSLIVKICGLSTPEALDVALDAGADMVGFVFFPPSPRHLSFDAARTLGAARARPRAESRADGRCRRCAASTRSSSALQPDMLQLHGKETPARVDRAQAALRPAGDEGDSGRGEERPRARRATYAAIADRLLFDARAPREATRPGGLGKAFDWQLLENLDPGVPFMLSGGLDAGNVGEALRITRRARRRCLLRRRARAGREGS